MSSLYCTCDEWKPNIDKINAPIQLQSARSGFRWQFDGLPFRYCPWCSKVLKVEGAAETQPYTQNEK